MLIYFGDNTKIEPAGDVGIANNGIANDGIASIASQQASQQNARLATLASIHFKHYNKLQQQVYDLDLEILEGPDHFIKDEITVAAFKTTTGLDNALNDFEREMHFTKLKILPNPASDQVIFNLTLGEMKESVSIQIYNIEGKLLEEIVNNSGLEAGLHKIPYNVSFLNSGVYNCKILGDGELIDIVKLMVK